MGRLRRSCHRRDETVLSRIVTTISAYEQCDSLDLAPLYRTVDTDVLDQVAQEPGITEIEFSYHGYDIRIDSDGRVDVTPEQG